MVATRAPILRIFLLTRFTSKAISFSLAYCLFLQGEPHNTHMSCRRIVPYHPLRTKLAAL